MGLSVGETNSPAEAEADRFSHAVSSGTSIHPTSPMAATLSRQPSCTSDEIAFGEIRSLSIMSASKPYDGSPPTGLDNVKESLSATCGRNPSPKNCACVDGSTASAKGDQDAWSNIVNATSGIDAASSIVRFLGLSATESSLTAMNSANVPMRKSSTLE